MPAFSSDGSVQNSRTSPTSSYDNLPRKSHEKSIGGVFTYTNGSGDMGFNEQPQDHYRTALKNQSLNTLPNGTSSGSVKGRERSDSKADSIRSATSALGRYPDKYERRNLTTMDPPRTKSFTTDQQSGPYQNGGTQHASRPSGSSVRVVPNGEPSTPTQTFPVEPTSQGMSTYASTGSGPANVEPTDYLSVPPSHNRYSSPAASTNISPQPTNSSVNAANTLPKLAHRHTLQVPRISTTRNSRDFSFSNTGLSDDAFIAAGRQSPTHRRSSVGIARRTTRSIASDLHLDEVPQDDDALRWTEAIRQKRASKRRKKEEEDDERVMVGTKVDQGHVNWVTAYNMLTGIRFTVSRTNAKMDRELTDADFQARHKFSFDITGNELTPSAKYDFKFKDYAPWVFRHLRAKFGLDPADYLMSLTSKYILSELGSPGKSGSFFYFSRDYKYIIKTIHHAEHKLLRKILREYYDHVCHNPNTLLSQFYGLHRVKIPYGRKIHFVVMNNLFPPHRDIHQTFDLKGSTIGRDFREEDLEKNPRATLKDLNWLRRNYHLEFGPGKKEVFIKQMERDVALLQKLKIMDYSLLVGIHDLNKGNEEKVRDKTLKVYEPGGERPSEEMPSQLTRTPSRMENMRHAQELRKTLKREKPKPMELSQAKMPEEILDDRKDKVFYSDDGGLRATHEDGTLGEEIYYLGIIDCLTHYGTVKRVENFWKGLSNNSSQISPIPPQGYGERFVNFVRGITMTKEEAERQQERGRSRGNGQSLDVPQPSRNEYLSPAAAARASVDVGEDGAQSPVDRTMSKALKQAVKSERKGKGEEDTPSRTIGTVKSPVANAQDDWNQSGSSSGMPGLSGNGSMALPVVEERDNEVASTGSRSARSGRSGLGEDRTETLHSSFAPTANGYTDTSAPSTLSESPVDYRYDRSPVSPREKSGSNDVLSNGNPLPGIPRLEPLNPDSMQDSVDPKKLDASTNGKAQEGNDTVEKRSRFNGRTDTLGRFDTA